MPRIMWKSFHLCFPSNLIKPSSSSSPPSCLPPSDAAVSDDPPNRHSILLINNFNLLYDHSSAAARRRFSDVLPSSSTVTTTSTSTSTAANSSSSFDNYDFAPGDDDDSSPPPDLTAVLASRRFFFSSPGRSNSITDSPDLRSRDNYETATATATTSKLLTGGNAVKQYVQSPDPYNDFRRSMQEMLDAVKLNDDGDLCRYEFLHELLLSYLTLNSADAHRFIIRAFADILVSLLSDGHRIS